MAKQRFSLNETMTDAVKNIEETKSSSEIVVQEPASPESISPETKREDEIPSAQLEKLRKRIAKSDSNNNMRNVPLSDDMLDKFEAIKKYLNKTRSKSTKETFISIGDLLNVAAQDFLNKYYK